MEHELKPCPYCGGVNLVVAGDYVSFFVECRTCHMRGPKIEGNPLKGCPLAENAWNALPRSLHSLPNVAINALLEKRKHDLVGDLRRILKEMDSECFKPLIQEMKKMVLELEKLESEEETGDETR